MTRSITIRLNLLAAALVLAIAACVLPAAQQQAFAEETFTLRYAQFVDGESFPKDYTGEAIEPKVELVAVGSEGHTEVIKATDYSGNAFKVEYDRNVDAGRAYVNIEPGDELKAAYPGSNDSFTLSFKIQPQYLVAATVTLPKTSYEYAAEPIKPAPKVEYNGKTLKEGEDYTVSYDHPQRIGTCIVTLTGQGNFKSTVKKTFKITRANMANMKITLSQDVFRYTGSSRIPTVTVKNGTHTLVKNRHYTLTFYRTKEIGTAKVVVKRVENSSYYYGYKTLEYRIIPQPVKLKSATASTTGVTLRWSASKDVNRYNVYRATVKNPTWKKLTRVSGTTYVDKTAKRGGSYQYYIRAVKGVDGELYRSAKSNVLKATMPLPSLKLNAPTKSGTGLKITWEDVDGVTKYTLNRRLPGGVWAPVYSGSAHSFTDTNVTAGRTYEYQVATTFNGKMITSNTVVGVPAAASNQTFVVTKYGSKGFKATWSKVTGAAGYELRWAPNKEFKDYHFATLTTTSFAKDPDYTKSGQKWYVKVRSYKTVNGTKTYSAWSTVKAITL